MKICIFEDYVVEGHELIEPFRFAMLKRNWREASEEIIRPVVEKSPRSFYEAYGLHKTGEPVEFQINQESGVSLEFTSHVTKMLDWLETSRGDVYVFDINGGMSTDEFRSLQEMIEIDISTEIVKEDLEWVVGPFGLLLVRRARELSVKHVIFTGSNHAPGSVKRACRAGLVSEEACDRIENLYYCGQFNIIEDNLVVGEKNDPENWERLFGYCQSL